jgi:hypothetical protein
MYRGLIDPYSRSPRSHEEASAAEEVTMVRSKEAFVVEKVRMLRITTTFDDLG